MQLRQGEVLCGHTTLELGGPARYFVQPESEDEVVEALSWADAQRLPAFVLGGGSNVLAADQGFDGLVVSTLGLRGLQFETVAHGELMTAYAGMSLDACVEASIQRGLSGIESLSGIPGTIGATPIQNVGAYGQEVSDAIVKVRVFDRRARRYTELTRSDCRFSYRDSLMKRDPEAFVVVQVQLELLRESPRVRYGELARALEGRPITGAAVREAVLSIRSSKSMVVDPEDENRRSVGSFFLNPIVDESVARELVAECVRAGIVATESEVPRFSAGPGRAKLSAAWLIERAGFSKGLRSGPVGISSKHSLALVHHGGGTTRELLEFAGRIRSGVRDRFGVELQPEPVRLGL